MADVASSVTFRLRIGGLRWLFVALMAAVLLVGVHLTAERVSIRDARAQAASQAMFYKSTLDAALERPAALPFILARDSAVQEALRDPNGARRLNPRLSSFARAAEVDAIYLMDRTGLTIAASNYLQEVTFLDQNYAFRPYFRDAMAGRAGAFFAIGATTGRAGYFVSEPVRGAQGQILGVIALKLDLSGLADVWRAAGERVLVVNPDGIIVLASDPDWTYRALGALPPAARSRLEAARQFGDQPLEPLDWQRRSDGQVSVAGKSHVLESVPVDKLGWQVLYLGDLAQAKDQARAAVGIAVLLLSLALAAALFLRSRRIGTALRVSQDDRRALRKLNDTLEREIDVRRKAEARLEAAQSELAATSRLAALGRLAASVTHELGQPLSAMRNYIASLRMNGAAEDIEAFTRRMEGVTERMEALTRQLRFFARPGEDGFKVLSMEAVIAGAQEMMAADLEAAGVELFIDMPDPAPMVRGNRLRLEQVLVNLLQNARDAVAGQEVARISVRVTQMGGDVTLRVSDTGPGIAPEIAGDIFEPFTSTKASGSGMGLGLSISRAIATDHGGTLTATQGESGASFLLTLPATKEGA